MAQPEPGQQLAADAPRTAATHLVGHHQRPWLRCPPAAGVIKMVRDGGVKGGKVHLCMAGGLTVTWGPPVALSHAQTQYLRPF